MKAQGYIEIDYQAMTDEQFEAFNATMQQYNMYYYRVHEGSREYYFCILNDVEVLSELLQLLESRSPILNGLWDIDGTPYGQIKTVDAETGEVSITGEPTYSLDLALHITHTPAEPLFDSEGNITGYETVSEFRPLHGFSGWALCQAY